EHCELVAADAERVVAGADHGAERIRDVLDRLVPRRMALRVVDDLQLVEVEDDERERPVVPPAARDLGVEVLYERAAVEEGHDRRGSASARTAPPRTEQSSPGWRRRVAPGVARPTGRGGPPGRRPR